MRIAFAICITAFAVGCAAPHHAEDRIVTQGSGGADQSDVAEPTIISVIIAGEVAHPGAYSLPAGIRVLAAISRAGGFTEDAYAQGVRVRRKDGRTLRLDLRGAEAGGRQDLALQDEEVVTVPRWMRPMI